MFIGLDVHKDFIQVATLEDASSKVKDSFKLPTRKEEILEYAKTLSKKDKVVLESTTNSSVIVNIFQNRGIKVTTSNPLKNGLIALSRVKTDKVDAETLVRLLASGYIPDVWHPPEEIGKLRRLMAFADSLIRERAMAKVRIHSILHRNLIEYKEYPELFNGRGMKFIEGVKLPEDEKILFDWELEVYHYLEEKITKVKVRIARKVMEDEESLRLMTVNGFDYYTALALKAAVGDITRFKEPKNLVSYFGLNSSIYQSGKSSHTGSISKKGRAHARWVITIAAHNAVLTPGPLRAFYMRVKRRSCRNVAIVAVASKLTRIIWHMLMKKENYRFSHPLRTAEKLASMRVRASGEVFKHRGLKKGEVSKGGRKAYLEARKNDHDKAIQGEHAYESFIAEREKPRKELSQNEDI